MPKNVLIASESAYRRILLSDMISSHKEIIVVDIARNSQEVIDIIKLKNPDFLILDIEYHYKE